MVRCREAPDFEGTADFAGSATIVKLSGLKGGEAENGYLLVLGCGFKFPPMPVIMDPTSGIGRNTALLPEHFKGCETC